MLEIENICEKDNLIDQVVHRRLENNSSNTPYVHNNVLMPKLEIPLFDGKNPRWWIKRCQNFFQFYNIPKFQKINLASAYLNDTANA